MQKDVLQETYDRGTSTLKILIASCVFGFPGILYFVKNIVVLLPESFGYLGMYALFLFVYIGSFFVPKKKFSVVFPGCVLIELLAFFFIQFQNDWGGLLVLFIAQICILFFLVLHLILRHKEEKNALRESIFLLILILILQLSLAIAVGK